MKKAIKKFSIILILYFFIMLLSKFNIYKIVAEMMLQNQDNDFYYLEVDNKYLTYDLENDVVIQSNFSGGHLQQWILYENSDGSIYVFNRYFQILMYGKIEKNWI